MSVKTYALTTRQRLIDFLGLTAGSLSTTQNNVLDRIIDAMTEQIERYTGRHFKQGTYTNEIYTSSAGFIFPKNTPIASVSGVQYRNTDQNVDDWTTLDTKNYRLDGNMVVAMGGYKFPVGAGQIRLTYVGGYDFDNTATFLSDTEAGDVEYAMWKLCAHAWNNRKGSLNIQSESIGDYSVTFRQALGIDPEIASLLDSYSQLSVGGSDTPYLY